MKTLTLSLLCLSFCMFQAGTAYSKAAHRVDQLPAFTHSHKNFRKNFKKEVLLEHRHSKRHALTKERKRLQYIRKHGNKAGVTVSTILKMSTYQSYIPHDQSSGNMRRLGKQGKVHGKRHHHRGQAQEYHQAASHLLI